MEAGERCLSIGTLQSRFANPAEWTLKADVKQVWNESNLSSVSCIPTALNIIMRSNDSELCVLKLAESKRGKTPSIIRYIKLHTVHWKQPQINTQNAQHEDQWRMLAMCTKSINGCTVAGDLYKCQAVNHTPLVSQGCVPINRYEMDGFKVMAASDAKA